MGLPADSLARQHEVGYSGRLAIESERVAPLKKAVQAIPQDGFRLCLKYVDGTEGVVDLSDLAGRGVFQTWSAKSVFEAVTVNLSGGIIWLGEINLCSDARFFRLTARPAEEIFPILQHMSVDA